MEASEQRTLQKNLVNFIIEDVFNAVSFEDVLKIKGNVWRCAGKTLTEREVGSLRSEVEILKQSALWRHLKDDLMWHAQRMLVNKSKSEEDLIAGKMLLYWISVVEARLRAMEDGREEGVLRQIKE